MVSEDEDRSTTPDVKCEAVKPYIMPVSYSEFNF